MYLTETCSHTHSVDYWLMNVRTHVTELRFKGTRFITKQVKEGLYKNFCIRHNTSQNQKLFNAVYSYMLTRVMCSQLIIWINWFSYFVLVIFIFGSMCFTVTVYYNIPFQFYNPIVNADNYKSQWFILHPLSQCIFCLWLRKEGEDLVET